MLPFLAVPAASVLTLITSLLIPPTTGFGDSPRQKQLARIDSLNRADTNGGSVPTGGGGDDGDDSPELLGDLRRLPLADLTPTGRDIRELLLEVGGSPESDVEADADTIPPLGSVEECARDTCCVWKHVADAMAAKFRGSSGRCTRWARMAVRLGFHDAGTWSKAAALAGVGGGGADGSLCLSGEVLDAENSGLEDMCLQMLDWHANYTSQGYPISMADLIQVGASVGAVTCPLGPRIRTFVGRRDWNSDNNASRPPPNNSSLLPSALAPAPDLIRLFRDKTIGPHALVALVGAHTTSQQRTVDGERAGSPQDATPGVWDTLFYAQTQIDDDGSSNSSAETGPEQGPVPPRVFRFPSDVALARDPTTKDEWRSFAGSGGQVHWNQDYARAYIRLSLLGVDNINNLTECTKVLPRAVREFSNPDQLRMDMWLGSSANTTEALQISEVVEAGDRLA